MTLTSPAVAAKVGDWFDDITVVAANLGWVAETIQTANITSPAAGGAETFGATGMITANLLIGARYEVAYCGGYSGTAGEAAWVRLRVKAGATVDSAGTLIPGCMLTMNATATGAVYPVSLAGTFVAAATGQYTVGVSVDRWSGAADFKLFSDDGTNQWGRIALTCVKLP
jgi:hypothetical protein